MSKPKNETDADNGPFAMGNALMKKFEDSGFDPMGLMHTGWFEKVADFNNEVANFVADRIREDAKTQSALLKCKSAEELQKVQMTFLEKTYAQYTLETGKLVKMGMDMMPATEGQTKHTPV
jgi:alpha-galactosidase/6-phospho-beta-glucosidase family protein